MDKKVTKISDEIWDELKNLQIEMFALPNQFVKDHVQRLSDFNDQLFLKLRSSAVLPALEKVLQQLVVTKEENGKRVSSPKYVLEEHPELGFVAVKLSNETLAMKLKVVKDFGDRDPEEDEFSEPAEATDDQASEL